MKLPWDPEIDTPATVAVIGGGAIGIEAALYARFLGYYVVLIESQKMAQSWRWQASAPMTVPFSQAASPLGLAALEAHRPDEELPASDAILTGRQFAEQYLVPLAKTDLLKESVHVHSRVCSISRIEARRHASMDIQDRADIEYRIAIHSKSRGWFSERADIILDCSGVSMPQGLAPGGGIALGEPEHDWAIRDALPDWQGKERDIVAGQKILLVGNNLATCENLLSLFELQQQSPETLVTWLIPLEYGMTNPLQCLERLQAAHPNAGHITSDPRIAMALQGLQPGVVTVPGLGIEKISTSPGGLTALIQSDEDNTLDIPCQLIINSLDPMADWSHAQSLRVGRSAILDRPEVEWLDADTETAFVDNPDAILTMEPHYYILGSKSYSLACSKFSLIQGHQQIRRAFALIGGRADLDLYSNIQR